MLLLAVMPAEAKKLAGRWSEARANAWYAALPWMSGCNYIPATAINQIEMWSKETYDPKQIDKELGWAQRAWLHHDARLSEQRCLSARPLGHEEAH